MSSDEEDDKGSFVRYRVFKKTWRHADVTKFLRILDALYRMWRRESGQAPKRGSMQRRRYLVDEEATDRPAVPRLPKNAYDPDWLAKLTPTELDDLSPSKEKYDFSHDRNLKRYAVLWSNFTTVYSGSYMYSGLLRSIGRRSSTG